MWEYLADHLARYHSFDRLDFLIDLSIKLLSNTCLMLFIILTNRFSQVMSSSEMFESHASHDQFY